jgi:hypothetical protein
VGIGEKVLVSVPNTATNIFMVAIPFPVSKRFAGLMPAKNEKSVFLFEKQGT